MLALRSLLIVPLAALLLSTSGGTGADGEEAATCNGLTPTIVGDDGPNILIGTPGDDVIMGLGDNDLIIGLGGNDTICGGDGNDLILGRDGDDWIDGGDGQDACFGGLGSDHVVNCQFSDIPTPITASAAQIGDNSLLVRVEGTLNFRGRVYVEYQAEDGGELFRTTAVSSQSRTFSVDLGRLRPDTTYTFKTVGQNGNGDTSEGPIQTFTTGPLPAGLQSATFTVTQGAPTHDLTFMEYNNANFGGIIAIDGEGHIVWYFDTQGHDVGPLAQKTNGNLVYLAEAADHPATGFALREITPLGEEVARADAECLRGPWHHEVFLLSDSEVMFLSRDIQDSFNDPTRLQEGDTINIWDQTTGEVSEVWNVFDFVDPATDRTPDSDRMEGVSWRGCSGLEPAQDWTHGNAAQQAPDGSVLYSARHLDQVISISPDFQSLNWRLGGPGSDFTFPDPSDKFYHQHAAMFTPEGNLLLFDNGNGRPAEEGGPYSRALELDLDFETMEARKVWEYRHTPDLFAVCCSIAHRLENGNTLIVFGSNFQADPCCRVFTTVEVSPEGDMAGDIVWEVLESDPTTNAQYRIYPANSVMGETRVSGP